VLLSGFIFIEPGEYKPKFHPPESARKSAGDKNTGSPYLWIELW
jgi:hypothetical protein